MLKAKILNTNNKELYSLTTLRDGLLIIIGQFVCIVGALLSVRFLTQLLSPKEYGKVALAITVSSLINQTVFSGINAGISRYFLVSKEAGKLVLFFSSAKKVLLLASLFIIAFGSFVLIAISVLYEWKVAFLGGLAGLFSIFSGINSAFSGVYNTDSKRLIVASMSALDMWLRNSLAIAAIYIFGSDSVAVFSGFLLSSVIIAILNLRISGLHYSEISQKNSGLCTKSSIKNILIVAWPLCGSGIFTWVQQSSDVWSIKHFGSPDEIGQYAVVFQFGYAPISMLSGVILTLLTPIFYKRAGDQKKQGGVSSITEITMQVALWSFVLTIAIFSFTYFSHDLIFRWIVAEPYRKVSYLLPWVLLAGGLFACGQTIILKMISEFDTKRFFVVKVVTAIIGVVSNILGAHFFGMEGVVAGLVIFSGLYFGWLILISKSPIKSCNKRADTI